MSVKGGKLSVIEVDISPVITKVNPFMPKGLVNNQLSSGSMKP